MKILQIHRGNEFRGIETGLGYRRVIKIKVLSIRNGIITGKLLKDDPGTDIKPYKKGQIGNWSVYAHLIAIGVLKKTRGAF